MSYAVMLQSEAAYFYGMCSPSSGDDMTSGIRNICIHFIYRQVVSN